MDSFIYGHEGDKYKLISILDEGGYAKVILCKQAWSDVEVPGYEDLVVKIGKEEHLKNELQIMKDNQESMYLPSLVDYGRVEL